MLIRCNVCSSFWKRKIFTKITTKHPKAQILAEGPIVEPTLGYIYLTKKTNQKEFFQILDKHLVPSKILQNFISDILPNMCTKNLLSISAGISRSEAGYKVLTYLHLMMWSNKSSNCKDHFGEDCWNIRNDPLEEFRDNTYSKEKIYPRHPFITWYLSLYSALIVPSTSLSFHSCFICINCS